MDEILDAALCVQRHPLTPLGPEASGSKHLDLASMQRSFAVLLIFENERDKAKRKLSQVKAERILSAR